MPLYVGLCVGVAVIIIIVIAVVVLLRRKNAQQQGVFDMDANGQGGETLLDILLSSPVVYCLVSLHRSSHLLFLLCAASSNVALISLLFVSPCRWSP